MKKLLTLIVCLFMTFATACQTVQKPEEKPEVASEIEIEKAIVVDAQGRLVLQLNEEEFMALYRAAEKWFKLRDEISNATVRRNIRIERKSEDQYLVTLLLDNGNIKLTAVIDVDNEELKELRRRMVRLTTGDPKVEIERISNDRFKVTMSIDDVSWSTELDANVQERFHWTSYVYGFASAVLVAIGVIAGNGAGFIPLL